MRTTSVFCAECVCGFRFETPEREFTCPTCKRLIVLKWGLTDDDAQLETADEKPGAEVAT
jgi:hypothetical protein